MHIILYQAGAFGDVVTAVIDKTDYVWARNRIVPIPNRMLYEQLKDITLPKVHDFNNAINQLSSKYDAVSHHNFLLQLLSKHDFILIDTISDKDFDYCYNRAATLAPKFHLKSNKMRVQYASKIKILMTQAKNNTDKVIQFSDIINGNLINVLKQWIETPLNEEIYDYFLKNILPNNPSYNF